PSLPPHTQTHPRTLAGGAQVPHPRTLAGEGRAPHPKTLAGEGRPPHPGTLSGEGWAPHPGTLAGERRAPHQYAGLPLYDAPDTPPCVQTSHKPSLTKVSILDRLIFTHSVWLQLSMNSATSLHILQREKPGTFLVRTSATSQRKVLSVRVPDHSDPSFVQDFLINEDSGSTPFSLEGSTVAFEDLFHLISFYCVSRDILPFTLKLPLAIASARSHKNLKTISHLGIEFWNSTLNIHLAPEQQPEEGGDVPATKCGGPKGLEREVGHLRTRPPGEVCFTTPNGALCFLNPLFGLEAPFSSGRRRQFQKSFKVRVSTENSSPLSPPSQPPPPVPLPLAPAPGPEPDPTPGQDLPPRSGEASYNLPRLDPTAPSCIRNKAWGRSVDSETYRVPAQAEPSRPLAPPAEARLGSPQDERAPGLPLRAPSRLVRGLTNHSFSSHEEEEEEEDPRTLPPRPQGGHGMGWAMKIFSSPETRLARAVVQRSRDRSTSFGRLIQDYVGQVREGGGQWTTNCQLLGSVRQFIGCAKRVLAGGTELEAEVLGLVEEQERDWVLEMALHKCVLKPLKHTVYCSLREFHTADGSLLQLQDNIQQCRQAGSLRLEVRVSPLDPGTLDKIKLQFRRMQKAYSPVKKVHYLLQVCKVVYEWLQTSQGEPYGADEFLPALSYVLAECDLPDLLLEVEYMMELLDQSELIGEGGYYLVSFYTSMFELQNYHNTQPTLEITSEIRHSLKQWHHRRRMCEPMPSASDFQNFVRVAYQDPEHGCTAKTLVVEQSDTAADLCRLCAEKFKVANHRQHGLYLVVDDRCRALPAHIHPRLIQAELQAQGGPGYYYFVYRPVEEGALAEAQCKLQREDAVDLDDGPVLTHHAGP
ncbi:ras and Rab interactor 2-like, partial [Narcine bancroftii]|uniref:ras and Rab interactor 2-like n=1 Tax=Narcine bancroftii TaxID=1343680 RepID=UPI003831DEF8